MKKSQKEDEIFQNKLRLYKEFCNYTFLGSFRAEKIKEFICKGVSIYHPSETEEYNTILECIIRYANTEREAIELLQLIYDKYPTLFRKQDEKGTVSLIYIAIVLNKKEIFDFLLNTIRLPIDATARQERTPFYLTVTSEVIFNEKEWILELVRRGADPYLVSQRDGKCPFELIKSRELQEEVAKERICFKENQITRQKKEKLSPLPAYFSSFCLNFLSSSKTDPKGYTRLLQEEPEIKQTKLKQD